MSCTLRRRSPWFPETWAAGGLMRPRPLPDHLLSSCPLCVLVIIPWSAYRFLFSSSPTITTSTLNALFTRFLSLSSPFILGLWSGLGHRRPHYRLVGRGMGITDIEAKRPIFLFLLLYNCVYGLLPLPSSLQCLVPLLRSSYSRVMMWQV